MLNVVERVEPNISEVTKKGNVLLQLGEFPEETSFREDMSNLPRSVSDAKRKLEEKQELLETAIEKNEAFGNIAKQLEGWVTAIAKEPVFTEFGKTTNPVTVEKRLQQLEKLRDETTDRKKDLQQLETLGQWLIDHAEDEPSVIANVEMQKAKLGKQLEEQQQKIDQKYIELQNILMHGQEFDENREDLESKLNDLESKVATLRPVSAIYVTVKNQEIDVQSLKEDLEKYEPVYSKVVEEGEQLVEDMEPGDEKEELVEKLSGSKTR